MGLEKYGPPERGAQGRGLMKREKEGELTADAWRTQKCEGLGGRIVGARRRRVIERERQERCRQSWRNGEMMGRDGVWRGVAKLMVLPGEIEVNQSSLNKSSGPRRIFKKCLFN